MNDNNYENEDFIINKGFYNEIKDLVNCPICNKIINKPMQCSICENNFCEKCINEYIELKLEKNYLKRNNKNENNIK